VGRFGTEVTYFGALQPERAKPVQPGGRGVHSGADGLTACRWGSCEEGRLTTIPKLAQFASALWFALSPALTAAGPSVAAESTAARLPSVAPSGAKEGPADNESPPPSGHVAAQLVSEFQALAPGETARVGLRLVHEPHWHTYWTVPGDAGLPTRLTWQLPPGFQAGALQWPVPQLLRVGSLANYGYEGTVLLPVEITVPATAAEGGKARLAANAQWLVCNDICIPESAELTLELPVSKAAHAAPARFRDEFAAAAARVPQPIALKQAAALIDGDRIRLTFAAGQPLDRLEFFPLEPSRLQAAAPQRLGTSAGAVTLDLLAVQPVAADFKVLRGVLVANGGPGRSEAGGGWAGTVELPLKAGVLASFAPDGATEASPSVAPSGAKEGSVTFAVALFGAFIGGLILNLMPCVFPVLSLKLLALVQHRHRGDPSLAAHGFAFAAGAIASFVLLAGALVALRAGGSQLGWGFQLQSPLFVALLTALFFGIGLNLLGAFEVSLGTALLNSKTVQSFDGHHLRGSAATGVLAVLVASPCTAPFMGAALGYAVTQPAPVGLSVFAALGAGMATPYLALTLSPGLLRRLPRPGSWMQHLRQLMAFPMFVTCVWLLWVLAQQIDVNSLALVLAALVALGLAAWSAGQAQRGARVFGWVGVAAAAVSALVMITATERGVVPAARAGTLRQDAEAWADWSPGALGQALSSGRPVFVDFTAAWCVTCQANKQLVLYSGRVESAFHARGVTLLRADWTNRNDAIARELQRFGRNGVPLYVLYDSSGRSHVLPEILTEATVLDALARM
jgi:thiol:disulfide interchange protein/DsbC/DsbD-like thiol-disulfide interchange protein